MKTQQAPPGAQSARVVPLNVALMNAQSNNGGMSSQIRYAANSVSNVLTGLENRLARIHAHAPTVFPGGGKSGLKVCVVMFLPYRSANAIRLLYTFISSEMVRLMVR